MFYLYCHVSQWLRRGFGLVIGFIGYLQDVTTNNYNAIADLHNLQSLHTNLLSPSALVFTDLYKTGTIKVSLNHTLPISLCYSTHKVFKSHVKSSQADFLYTSATTNFPWLPPTENWLAEPKEIYHLYSRGTDTHHRKHVTWPPSNAAWLHRGHGKHSLLYCCVLDRVYRAVAWQRVDQIRYNTYVIYRRGHAHPSAANATKE
jgi:hypothetical protein